MLTDFEKFDLTLKGKNYMNINSRANAFVVSAMALSSLLTVRAQEVDVDALTGALNAEIETVGGEKEDSTGKTGEDAASNVAVVTAEGKGDTKKDAKLAAFRAAVEKAVGVYVDAESLMENSELIKDRVNTISNADIQKYETLKESQMKSGMYFCQIKAWVEKKAIAPKFADVFPAAFKDVREAAETIHVIKITKQAREGDAASLMTAAIADVDPMRNWVRLSVAKGESLRQVTEFPANNSEKVEVAEVAGKGLYAVRYSMKIDEDAYFKGFLPHFKQTLEKMQVGGAEEATLSSSPLGAGGYLSGASISQSEAGDVILMTSVGASQTLPSDLQVFDPHRYAYVGHTYFVNPVSLEGFPGSTISGGPIGRGTGGNPSHFMFDRSKGLSKIQSDRTYNLWLMDKMNKRKTVVQCSAYKVPAKALTAYWKGVFGGLDSEYVMGNAKRFAINDVCEQVEIALIDARGDQIAVRKDRVPGLLLVNGLWSDSALMARECWERCNVFNSFFVRPMFVARLPWARKENIFATEVQRDAFFALTDEELSEVAQVEIRFAGGKKAKDVFRDAK